MPIQDDLPTLFAYTRWADDRLIAAARTLTPEQYTKEPVPGWVSVRDSLIHIAWATHLWSLRLRGEPATHRSTADEFPTIDDVERLFHQGHDTFDRLIADLTPERLASVWAYTDMQGIARKLPLWTIYRHVANHATYHRGQIASKFKRLGVEPPVTDFAFWVFKQTPQA